MLWIPVVILKNCYFSQLIHLIEIYPVKVKINFTNFKLLAEMFPHVLIIIADMTSRSYFQCFKLFQPEMFLSEMQ